MSLLEKSQRVHPQALDFYTSKNIQRLGRQFSKQANKADADLTPLNQEFKLILSTLGFIRRTVNSRWFGHTIIELPPNNRMDVPCPIPESYLATIRPMDSALSTELDGIGAARAEGQENRFRLPAAGIVHALYAANCPGFSTDVVRTFLSKELNWERAHLVEQARVLSPMRTRVVTKASETGPLAADQEIPWLVQEVYSVD
jgi:hypothetical protein